MATPLPTTSEPVAELESAKREFRSQTTLLGAGWLTTWLALYIYLLPRALMASRDGDIDQP